jgi:hypothetical protein
MNSKTLLFSIIAGTALMALPLQALAWRGGGFHYGGGFHGGGGYHYGGYNGYHTGGYGGYHYGGCYGGGFAAGAVTGAAAGAAATSAAYYNPYAPGVYYHPVLAAAAGY